VTVYLSAFTCHELAQINDHDPSDAEGCIEGEVTPARPDTEKHTG
jgi:hypothetical protein